MEVDVGQLENAFNAASFLVNQAWMRLGSGSETHSLPVSYGMKMKRYYCNPDTASWRYRSCLCRPVSYACPCYLLSPTYGHRSPRWDDQLDSFTMIRMGSAVSQDVPLLAARVSSTIQSPDRILASMGDATSEDKQRKVSRV